ncbi:MAG TPA: tRNA dimethylallyltransferase, partial [Candidatus Eisenbacteria bacterium]
MEGSHVLHAELAALDPGSAERLHRNDAQRITRALEVVLLTGAPMGTLWEAGESPSPLAARCRLLVLERPREEIYARIERRTGELLSGGMIEEAARVLASGVDPGSPTFKAHGYPEIARHLAGDIDRDELTRRLNQVTRNYAKRQMTWFRRLPGALSVPVSGEESPAETAAKALARLEDIT